MIVYRVGKTTFANDINGEGARLHGGRWNHPLTAVIYTSESRALAVLEYSVNVNIESIPRALSITSFEINESDILEVKIAGLPGNWKEMPAPAACKDFGTALLKSGKAGVIKIPSSIINEEYNYLINPIYTNSKKLKIASIADFVFDVRIKSV